MAASLELAISAIRSGRKEEGRQLLNLLIQQNPNNDKAWLWMSSVVDTDEQRARCLYHVLAIDPNSQIARRGLQLLGIVLSDSRPVKVPRDSQPIHIPKPSNPTGERRPFLIDPQTITKELPFTPVSPPMSAPVEASPAVLSIDVENVDDQSGVDSKPVPVQPPQPASPSEPVPISRTTETQPLPEPSQPANPSNPVPVTPASQETPSQPVPPVSPPQQHPSTPVPVNEVQQPLQPQNSLPSNPAPQAPQPATQPDSRPFDPNSQPPAYTQSIPGNQQYGNEQGQPSAPAQTRPSQPVPVIYPNQPGMQPPQSYQAPPSGSADATSGMPPQQPVQHQSQYPTPPVHSNTTQGMPPPQLQHPSEPVMPIHSTATMGMTAYGQAAAPYPAPGQSVHSSATMMMPGMSDAEARARLANSQAIPTSNPTAMALQHAANQPGPQYMGLNQPYDEEEDEDDEVNILAVVIFGTLSVTALGGLGMLILLVFTAPV
jgi:hypothetical protein